MGFNKKKESGMPPFVSVCIVWFFCFFFYSQIVVGGICCHDNTRFPISSDTNTDPLRLQHTKRRIAHLYRHAEKCSLVLLKLSHCE